MDESEKAGQEPKYLVPLLLGLVAKTKCRVDGAVSQPRVCFVYACVSIPSFYLFGVDSPKGFSQRV